MKRAVAFDKASNYASDLAALMFSQDTPPDKGLVESMLHYAFTDGAKLAAWSAAVFLLLGFASTFNLGARKEKKQKA